MLEVTNDMEKTQQGTAVVYFTAAWCVPCRQLKPQFAKAGTIDKDNNYYIVDVEQIDNTYLEKYEMLEPIYNVSNVLLDRFLPANPSNEFCQIQLDVV